ncbi:MAG: thioredoxin family protein [Rudanella sp.]|nr:thioredoxin family protein [Rudanella sp.]
MALFRSTIFLVLLVSISPAFADGIRFFHGSWSQVLAEARRQNKPIFIDVYTTWCGPCKLMSAQAFPNARVGLRMNDNFINYKIDAEKGEGQTVAQRYGVQAFPTSLFISIEGKLIRRTLGYNGIDWFLAEAQRALSDANESHTMALWNKKYDAGDRSPAFMRGMLRKQAEYDRPTGDVLDDYVKILPKTDSLAMEEIQFLGKMLSTTYTKAYLLLAEKAIQMARDSTKRPLTANLSNAFVRAEKNDLNDAVAAQDELLVESLIKNKAAKQRLEMGVGKSPLSPEQKALLERAADDTRLRFYQASRLKAHYVSLVKKIAETRLMAKTDAELARADSLTFDQLTIPSGNVSAILPDTTNQSATADSVATIVSPKKPVSSLTARQLCDLAKGLTDNSSDKKDMALALGWSARAVQLDACPPNVIAHARMLTRMGRKVEARQQLSKAIAANQDNENGKALLQGELARLK